MKFSNFLRVTTSLMALLSFDPVFACIGGSGYLPKNSLRIPANQKAMTGINQTEFNEVLDRIEEVYAPIVRQYGGNLTIRRDWNNAEVNAYANREGSNYIVMMYGGLARHQVITPDAFTLVACHEVGHHIGGVPRYPDNGGWASNEGQSDYFATTKCMRKIFMKDDNESIVRGMSIDALVKSKCESEHSAGNEQAICKRISMAGQKSASLFASMQNRPFPQFNTPDQNVVTSTYNSHPAYQCRLDTYFSGAVCKVGDETEIGQQDPNVGTCNRKNNDTEGLRSLCWFKPNSSDGGGTNPGGGVANTPVVNGQSSITSNNPNMPIPISINVGNFPGARGFVIEATKPNTVFTNPNANTTDPRNSGGYQVISGTVGVYQLIPAKQLPGWGSYQFRVLPLDKNKRAIGKFSNPFQLILRR